MIEVEVIAVEVITVEVVANDRRLRLHGARRLAERLPEGRITVFEDADHLTTLLAGGRRILERHGSTGDGRPCAPAGASGGE